MKKIILLMIFIIPSIFSCMEINSSEVDTLFYINASECIFIEDLNITIYGKNPIYVPTEYDFSGGEGNILEIPEYNITIIGKNQKYEHQILNITDNGIVELEMFNLTLNVEVPKDLPSPEKEIVKILKYGERYVNDKITCIAPSFPLINKNITLNYGEKYTEKEYNLNILCKDINSISHTLNYGEVKVFGDRNVTCIAPKICPTCPVCPTLTALDVTLQPGETKTYEENKVKMTCIYAMKEVYKSSFDLDTALLDNCGNTITLGAGTGDKICIDNLDDFCITDMVKSGNLKGCVEHLDNQVVQERESCLYSLELLQDEYDKKQKDLELASLRLNDREHSDRSIITWIIVACAFIFLVYAVYNIYVRIKIPKDDTFVPEMNIEMPRNVDKLSRRDELE